MELTFDIAIVTGVILFLIIFLYKEWISATLTFFIAIVVLVLSNVISPKQALEGFANEQLATIVLLLLVGQVLNKSEAVDTIFKKFLKPTDTPNNFRIKMLGSVGLSSSVFNNTPLVAMLMPFVYSWAKKKNQPVSRYLLPLSYASILGGCITLIGTSTNLVVSALAEEYGELPLNMFDFTLIGSIMFVIGIVYLFFFGNRILRNRVLVQDDDNKSDRKFFFETTINTASQLIGKTIEEGGLRNLIGLYVVELQRGDKIIRPVSSNEILMEGDCLFFAGGVEEIKSLNVKALGLSYPNSVDYIGGDRKIAEIVVSHNSKFAGLKIKNSEIRGKYDCAILAIHRNGERVWGQLGQVVLRPGDVLLIAPGNDFDKRIANDPSFYVISKSEEEEEIDNNKALLLFVGMLGAIVLTTFQIVSLFKSLLLLVLFSIFTKLFNYKDIRSAIDFNLIMIIALGLALGKAINASGLDDLISAGVAPIHASLGTIGVMFLIFAVTNIMAALITSKAAVSVAIPVVISIAHSFGYDAKAFVLLVAFAGAANFITPIGYQTNLMVFGPGGYTFKDYVKLGSPLTVIYMLVTVIGLHLIYLS